MPANSEVEAVRVQEGWGWGQDELTARGTQIAREFKNTREVENSWAGPPWGR